MFQQNLNSVTPSTVYLDQENLMLENMLSSIVSSCKINSTTESHVAEPKGKNIFVCTLCQVFSSASSDIIDHISKNHALTEGAIPESYVSKLKPLNKNDKAKNSKSHGASKKSTVKSQEISTKRVPLEEPVIDLDGQYWCKNCQKHFKKFRQFSRHICLEVDNQDEMPEDSEVDFDDTMNFKSCTEIPPEPWSKPKKRKAPDKDIYFDHEGSAKIDYQVDVVKYLRNWKEDPKYVPTFDDKKEKEAFENHLKSIDYTYVDVLFVKIKSKLKSPKGNLNMKQSGYIYRCVLCNKVTNVLSRMRLHCLIHTKCKPFTCPKCSFSTNIKASLHSHMRTHTGNLFQCSECSFQSNKRSHLVDHMQTHSTVRQGCKLCKNSYKTLRSLKMHVKKYHNNPNGKKYLKSLSAKEIQKNFLKRDVNKRYKPPEICRLTKYVASEIQNEVLEKKIETNSISDNINNGKSQEDVSTESNSTNFTDIISETHYEVATESSLTNFSDLISKSETHDEVSTESNLTNFSNIINKSDTHDEVSTESNITNFSDILSDNQTQDVSKISKETINLIRIPNVPILPDCIVRIEPLANFSDMISKSETHDEVSPESNLANFSDMISKGETHDEVSTERNITNFSDIIRNSQAQDISNISKEGINLFSIPNAPILQDCSVRIEPLANEILSHYQDNGDCALHNQNFSSLPTFGTHASKVNLNRNNQSAESKNTQISLEDINFSDSQVLSSLLDCSVILEPLNKDYLDILNNFLQDKSDNNNELFNEVFQPSSTSNLLTSNDPLNGNASSSNIMPINGINQIDLTNSVILDECHDEINIDLLDECLRNPNITCQDISNISFQVPNSTVLSNTQQSKNFNLQEINMNFSENQLIQKDISDNIFQLSTELGEPKPEELKLFEKCKRAPAYVCCVCSGIFICSSTLKAHLKEHVDSKNNANSVLSGSGENYKSLQISNSQPSLNEDICKILEESSNTDEERELEKLFTSSLHKMWYLPEVSVVLENDPTLANFIEEIPIFPLNDQSDALQLDGEIFSQ